MDSGVIQVCDPGCGIRIQVWDSGVMGLVGSRVWDPDPGVGFRFAPLSPDHLQGSESRKMSGDVCSHCMPPPLLASWV